jgi:hypothetical protein
VVSRKNVTRVMWYILAQLSSLNNTMPEHIYRVRAIELRNAAIFSLVIFSII